MDKEDKKDFQIRIECTENEGYILQVTDMDEPMEDKKYTFASVDEVVNKVRSLLGDEEAEEKDEVPTDPEEVKQHLHAKNIGSTARDMSEKGY